MSPQNPASPDDRKDGATHSGNEPRERTTPNADMQAEDAGTADSGNEDNDSGTAATRAMKQTSKTPSESGNPR